MAKCAFIVLPFLGHINPTLSIGKELLRRGHEVTWLCMLGEVYDLIPEGGYFQHIKTATVDNSKIGLGMGTLKALYEDVLIPLNRHMHKEVQPYMIRENYDLVLSDHQTFSGAILAHEFGLPFVTTVTTPAAIEQSRDFPEVLNFERGQIVGLQQELGIKGDEPLICNSPLTLVFSTLAFVGSNDFPSTYKFIGSTTEQRKNYDIDISGIDALDSSKPKVLITMGSIIKLGIDFIDLIIEAFKDEEVSVILVGDPALKKQWPANFLVYTYIPQVQVLDKVDAVVCHAGYNTVCESICAGVPMILLPMVNDQSYIATKVVNCGAGIRLKYRRMRSEHLKNACTALLSQEKYKTAVEQMKQSFEDAGGTLKAVELIEEFLKEEMEALLGKSSKGYKKFPVD